MSKLYNEAISVTTDRARKDVREFIWRGRRYKVRSIVKCWRVRHTWWADDGGVNRWYYRVQAARNGNSAGTYDLYFDGNKRHWCLERIWD